MEEWLKARLSELERAALLRQPMDSELHWRAAPDGQEWLDACSNDYLGLAAHPVSRETMDSSLSARSGAGASRLVQGTFQEHTELEGELADWLGTEASLLTSSAFAANLGTMPALGEEGGLIVSDALNHASIVDGCRLARARVVVTPHLQLEPVEAALKSRGSGAAWVVTEALFSMDGDSPNLPELRKLCDRYDAGLVVDEAHSLGALGPGGAGLAAEPGARADLVVAGLGKAIGSQGGVLAGSQAMRTWLWNRARAFVFSTAPSPVLARLALGQVRATRAAHAARARLQRLSQELRESLVSRGFQVPNGSCGAILPVVLGTNERAMTAMIELRARGILVQAIRPPTVPAGAARLRLTVHADWPDNAVPRLVGALEAVCGS